MKTLADFKRRLKVGVKLHTTYHQAFAGRNEKGEYLLKDEDKGIREVTLVQSNRFALKTKLKDVMRDSYCDFPKASNFRILNENSIMILEHDFRDRSIGGTGELIPLLTYTFVD